MNTGINIQGMEKDAIKTTVEEVSKAVMEVIGSSAGDVVKIAAIESLGRMGEMRNVISNCVVNGVCDDE